MCEEWPWEEGNPSQLLQFLSVDEIRLNSQVAKMDPLVCFIRILLFLVKNINYENNENITQFF